MKKVLLVATLILFSISVFAIKWEEADVPIFFNNIVPPKMPLHTYWAEAEDNENSGGLFETENAYGKKLVYIQNQDSKNNFAQFKFNVDKKGKYLIMGGTGNVSYDYVSPVALFINGEFVQSFTKTPEALNAVWGWSSANRWVSYGMVELDKGEYVFRFDVIGPRNMDTLYIQTFDALCLVDSKYINPNMVLSNVRINKFLVNDTDTKNVKFKDNLKIELLAKLDKSVFNDPIKLEIPIELCHKKFLVKEYTATVQLNGVGKDAVLNCDLTVPFDCPTGEYYLVCPKISDKHILDFHIEGKYRALKEKPLSVENLKLIDIRQESNNLFFKVSGNIVNTANSDRLIILFEKKKDVSYYATSVKIDLAGNTGQYVSKELSVPLPKDMPQGNEKVLLFLNKDVSLQDNCSVHIKSDYTEKTTGLKPISYGFYKDNTGMTQVWYANQYVTLYWQGEPLMVISGMFNGPYMSYSTEEKDFEGLKENIEKLKARGIKHVYLFTQGTMEAKVPYQWEYIMDYLESEGFTYVIGYPSGCDQLYQTKNIIRPIRASKPIMENGVTGKFSKLMKPTDFGCWGEDIISMKGIILKDNEPNEVIDLSVTPKEGAFLVEYDFGNTTNDVILVPLCHYLHCMANPWDDHNFNSKEVSERLANINLRPGFRGFIDLIMQNERGLYNDIESFFIENESFLKIREKQLKDKYKTFDNLKKSWNVQGEFVKSFKDAASLYPFLTKENIIYVTNGDNKIYKIDKNSPYWYEWIDMRDDSYGTLQDEMIDTVKKVVDAPAYIKLCGMPESYDSPKKESRLGYDGVGIESYATGDGHVNYNVGYRYLETLVSKKAMVGASTEFGRGWADDMPANWPDIHGLFYDMGVSHFFGNKITYLFLLDVLPQSLYERNRILRDPRILEWMNLWQQVLDDKKDIIKDYKPVVYASFPKPDAWWVQYSERRSVLDNNDGKGINSIKASNGVWVIGSSDMFIDTPAIFITLNDKPASTYYKDDFEKLLALNDREIIMIGCRRDLGTLSVDKYFTDEYFEDNENTYQVLNVPVGAEITQETNGKVWGFKLGKLQICAVEAKKGYGLENSVKYAKLDPVPEKYKNAAGYLENLLGISFVTYNQGAYKAVGLKLKDKDTVILHTMNEEGGDTIKYVAKKDSLVELPYTNFVKEAKAGDVVEITFPKATPENKSTGPGLGYVKITGENLSDIEFEGLVLDGETKASGNGYEIPGLVKGLTLPKPKRKELIKNQTIEVKKATAGFDNAMMVYDEGMYGAAQDWLLEYLPLGGEELSCAFNFALGNVKLMRGKIDAAIKFYETALEREPDNMDVKCALACAIFTKDKEKAIAIWKECPTPEAEANLKFATSNN